MPQDPPTEDGRASRAVRFGVLVAAVAAVGIAISALWPDDDACSFRTTVSDGVATGAPVSPEEALEFQLATDDALPSDDPDDYVLDREGGVATYTTDGAVIRLVNAGETWYVTSLEIADC